MTVNINDIISKWPMEKRLEYIKQMKLQCDKNPEFEQMFFDKYFEDLINGGKVPFEDVLQIFEVSFDVDDIEGEDTPEKEDGDVCEEKGTGEKPLPKVFVEGDMLYLYASFEFYSKFNVVNNSAKTLNVNVFPEENLLEIICDEKNPFLDKYVTHRVTFPEEYDLDTITLNLKQGVLFVDADYKKKATALEIKEIY